MLECEGLGCGKVFHIECLIARRKRVLWDRRAGELHVYCQQHGRELREHYEELNWECMEQVVTLVVHAHVVSRDLEYQRNFTREVEECAPQPAPELTFEGQRNVKQLYA